MRPCTSDSSSRRCARGPTSRRPSATSSTSPELADALGIDCVWLGEIHFTPTRSVISRLAAGGQRHREPHAPAAHRHRGPDAAAEPPAAHRRGGRHRRSHQRRAVRVRHRAQRRRADLRHLRRAVRGEPGALPRGAGDHPPRLGGRAVQLRGRVLSRAERDCHAAPVPGAASADPDGDDERRDVSGRRAHGPADLRRPAHDRDPRSAGAARTVPAGVARGRASRATERLPAHPRLRLDHREGRRRGAARA
jgi:hypothetical protein